MLEQIFVLLSIVVAMTYAFNRLEWLIEDKQIIKYTPYIYGIIYGLFAVLLSFFRFESELIPNFGVSFIILVIGLLYKGKSVYLMSTVIYMIWIYALPFMDTQLPLYIYIIIALIALFIYEFFKLVNKFWMGIIILSITKLISFLSLSIFTDIPQVTVELFIIHTILNVIFMTVAITEMNYLDRSNELVRYYRARTYLDDLTGAENRRSLNEAMGKIKGPVALVIIDIDHFKTINDTFGHIRGDQILLDITQQLQTLIRGVGTLYRIGGDEFVILMPKVSRAEAIRETYRIYQNLDIETEGTTSFTPYKVTVSLGLAHCPSDVSHYTELYDAADKKMYVAKDIGRNTLHY